MTKISNSPQLQVYGKDESVMLANFTGTINPVAILEDKVIQLLSEQCRKAKEEAQNAGGNLSASLELFSTLEGVLKSYRKIRDEYYDRIDIEREREEAEQRLQEAMSEIKVSTPPSE